jgi:hypothetical protein
MKCLEAWLRKARSRRAIIDIRDAGSFIVRASRKGASRVLSVRNRRSVRIWHDLEETQCPEGMLVDKPVEQSGTFIVARQQRCQTLIELYR